MMAQRENGDLPGSGMFRPAQTLSTVLCCICGTGMPPNPSGMCANCLRSRSDVSGELPRHTAVIFCPECSSYLQPPRSWSRAALESRELLSFLLRRLRRPLARSGARLTNAAFVFSEPHSKRIRLRLALQREVAPGAILEQTHAVEFVVHDRLCESCSRASTNPDQWTAAVQLRQHVLHRRTFLYLEQLILRHGAAARALRISATDRGVDFYFGNRSHASHLVDFLGSVAPVRHRADKQLVSHDPKSNLYNYKHTFSVEVCPICREDLICLPRKLATDLGNLGPIVLCVKVSNYLTLLDPFTLRGAHLDAKEFWRTPFQPLLTSRQLVEYIVLDVELESSEIKVDGLGYQLARAQVARLSDFGKNDNIFVVKTHLGHLLSPGDYALGYDLYGANTNDVEVDNHKGLVLPDAVLVKKSYEEKRRSTRPKPRSWKLKRLNMDVDVPAGAGRSGKGGEQDLQDSEYEQFLRDLEENPNLTFNINLYKNDEYQRSEAASTVDGSELPSIPLDELLEDLTLNEEEEDEGEDEGEADAEEGGGGSNAGGSRMVDTCCKVRNIWITQHRIKLTTTQPAKMSSDAEAQAEADTGAVLPASVEHVHEAVHAIKMGKVIAVPTDTLYGFACDACSVDAVSRIYDIKGRKQTSPLAICVADVVDIPRFAVVDHLPPGLLDNLLPGPVTVVLKRGEHSILDKSLNPGLDSIGVRVPDFEFIRAIARGSSSALALTSANLSGQSSSISIKDFEQLWQHCAYIYDAGVLPSGRAGSTVIDLTLPRMFKILRDGSAKVKTTAILDKFGYSEAPPK